MNEMNETTGQTRTEAVEMVLAVLRDGSRNDRYLRVSDDGEYFTTPDREFLTADGRETPPSVKIPVAYDSTEYEEEEWAAALLDELDAVCEEAPE